MLTFHNIYSEVQEQVQDETTDSLTLIKRAINQGMKKFANTLNRDWRLTRKTFSTVASQQFYQFPEDAVRVKTVIIEISDIAYPLQEVVDEEEWNLLNVRGTQSSDIPEFFFIRGNDEVGIWPIPATAVASAGTLVYERRVRDMSQDNYTTGTVTLTNNSAAVTGSSTVFNANMVGRSLRADDPAGDGMWYKIASFTSTTAITLEQTFGGTTASGLTYVIGELPDTPEEYHESLIDYACYRYYLRKKSRSEARDMRIAFENALEDCKANYSSKTTSQYIGPLKARNPPFFLQEPPEIS